HGARVSRASGGGGGASCGRRSRLLSAFASAAFAFLIVFATAHGQVPAPPGAPPSRQLGRLEQESVDETMAALGSRVDPAPQGKVIGQIHVVNQEVFSRRDWIFQRLNLLHRTTRPEMVARELLVKPGQPYDEVLVDESIRNLQAPATQVNADRSGFSPPPLSSVVAIIPVIPVNPTWPPVPIVAPAPAGAGPPRPDTVDLLVVTRDLWSLRFNTNFEFQQNTLSSLSSSLSENNLFGWRKYLSVVFVMDQGHAGVGPAYFDPNVAGTRLTLLASAIAWYARDNRTYEGDTEQFSLRYPLFSLASHWGGGVDVAHQDTVVRSFRGSQLRVRDLLATPGVTEELPYIFRSKIVTVDASVVRSFGVTILQRLTFGHRVDTRRSEVLPDFPTDPANPLLAKQFLNEVAPLSETRSEPYLRYDVFTARYLVVRNLDSFDLRENRRLGPSLSLEIAYGAPALGADFSAFPISGSISWAIAPRGSYSYALLQASARVREAELRGAEIIDRRVAGELFLATPVLGRVLRLVLDGQVDTVQADSTRARFSLGGSTGLRGYAIGDFDGTTQMVGHVEVRSLPVAVFSQRLGGLLFYDVGHAAPSFSALVPHHDVGLGLRWLIPQLNSSVLRFDWAVATQGTTVTRAGLPGRFTAGFFQAF
ncbi:MAG: hypothetical protein ABI560_14905, partial [Myxococcales bacterium]